MSFFCLFSAPPTFNLIFNFSLALNHGLLKLIVFLSQSPNYTYTSHISRVEWNHNKHHTKQVELKRENGKNVITTRNKSSLFLTETCHAVVCFSFIPTSLRVPFFPTSCCIIKTATVTHSILARRYCRNKMKRRQLVMWILNCVGSCFVIPSGDNQNMTEAPRKDNSKGEMKEINKKGLKVNQTYPKISLQFPIRWFFIARPSQCLFINYPLCRPVSQVANLLQFFITMPRHCCKSTEKRWTFWKYTFF